MKNSTRINRALAAKKKFFLFLTLLTLSIGQMWGTSYTITFNGSVNESTLISGTAASITGNSTYVTGNISSISRAYGPTSNGVKVGASSNAGNFTINLSSSGQVTPTSIVVNCKLYNSNKAATVNVNNIGAQSVSSDFSDVTFTTTTALTSLTIASSKYIWVKSITVNYNTTPAYTVTWTINPVAGGSLSTTSGTSTIVTPTNGWRYASPAYTVSTGASSVTQSTNTFTATPTQNSTIQINMEQIPTHTVTWSANGNTSNTSTVAEGADIEFPESATGCTGGTFKGWTANPIVGTSDVPPTYVTSATMGEDDITYYAVFADEDSDESSKTYELVIDYSDFVNSGGYGANNGDHSSTATATDDSGATIDIDWTSSNVMRGASPNDTKMQFKNAPGYIYNTTNLGTINSITIADGSKVSSIKGSSENPSSEGTPASYFKIVGSTGNGNTGYATSATINFTKTTNVTTTSNYRTSCCTSLAQINGSINLSHF